MSRICKEVRAQAVAPLVEAGNVYLPNPRPDGRLRPERAWLEDFLDQCTAFPKARTTTTSMR